MTIRETPSIDRRRGAAPRAFARGVGVSLAAAVVLGLVNYLTRRLLAHGLDQASYGFFYSAFALASVWAAFVGGGFGYSVLVLVAKYRAQRLHDRAAAVLGHVFLVTLAGGGIAASVTLVAAPGLLQSYFGFPSGFAPFALICLFIPVSAALTILLAALTALQDFTAKNVVHAGQYVLVLLVVCMGVRTWGLKAPGGGFAAASALLVLATLVYLHVKYRLIAWSGIFEKSTVRETWRLAGWATVSSTALLAMSSIDTLMLTRLRGLDVVAVYNIALPVVQIFLIAMVVPLVFVPIAADLWHQGRREEMAVLSAFVVRVVVLFGWALVIFLIPSARLLIRLLFGMRLEAAVPLTILGAGVPLLVLARFFMNLLLVVDRPVVVAGASAAAVALSLVLNPVLIVLWGGAGAAAATVTSYAVLLCLVQRGLRRMLLVGTCLRACVRASVAGAACCCVAWIGRMAGSGTWPSLGASLAAAALYLAMERRSVFGLWREGREILAGAPVAEREAA